MAEKGPTNSQALKTVEELLQCPICLDQFKEPKTLPCMHTFCKECVGHLPLSPQGSKHALTCPICRDPAQLPADGVKGLPTSFQVNSLIDLHQLMKKISQVHRASCDVCDKDQPMGFCQQCEQLLCQLCIDAHRRLAKLFAGHSILSMEQISSSTSKLVPVKLPPTMECSSHKKPLDIYCNTCKTIVCHLCTVKVHKDHDCEPITDVIEKHLQEIKESLKPVREKRIAAAQKKQEIEQRMREVLKNRDRVQKEVRAKGEQLKVQYAAAIDRSVLQLTQQVHAVGEQKISLLSSQNEHSQTSVALLQSCEEYVEGELRMGSQQQILFAKQQLVERMKMVASKVEIKELSPLENVGIHFMVNADATKVCTDIGQVESHTVLSECRATSLKEMVVCRETKIVLFNTPLDVCIPIFLISCQITAPAATCPTDCNISETSPGKFEASYTPVSLGPHRVRIAVGGVDIPGSPFETQAIPMKKKIGVPKPFGITIGKNDEIIVTELMIGCVSIFSHDGQKIRSFSSKGSSPGQLKSPTGVAVTPNNHILVADEGNHRIQVFTMEGRFVNQIGRGGNGCLEFVLPTSVFVHPTGKIAVADTGNHRIQVLNNDFTFSHAFGTCGSQPGQFDEPYGITADSQGLLYIADKLNHRLQKFTLEGAFITQFGSRGTGEGHLAFPFGVAMDTTTNIVYVSESGNHRISSFSSQGKFLGYFGNHGNKDHQFNEPNGIAIDKYGLLHICDTDNDRVVSYSQL